MLPLPLHQDLAFFSDTCTHHSTTTHRNQGGITRLCQMVSCDKGRAMPLSLHQGSRFFLRYLHKIACEHSERNPMHSNVQRAARTPHRTQHIALQARACSLVPCCTPGSCLTGTPSSLSPPPRTLISNLAPHCSTPSAAPPPGPAANCYPCTLAPTMHPTARHPLLPQPERLSTLQSAP
jgi:hypothetical protein